MVERTIFVGDAHGCLDELRRLLYLCDWDPGRDRLVLLGDLVDRGPDPAGTVRFAMRELVPSGAVVLQGNHEEKLCRWRLRQDQARLDGRPNRMRPPSPSRRAEWESLSEDEVSWLRSLPSVWRAPAGDPAEGWIAVHAGLRPGIRPELQDADELCRNRFLRADGVPIPLTEDLSDPPDGVPWTSLWDGPESVVYGHWVHSLESHRLSSPREGVTCAGLDTGCCFGGLLTAMILRQPGDPPDFLSVVARREYCQPGAGRS